MFNKSVLGFTLIELLIAVSILALLSGIGLVKYQDVKKGALDAKRQADIDVIAKTYEEQAFDPKTGVYRPLLASDFTNKQLPAPPEGGTYSGLVSTAISSDFKVCAALEGNPTPTCDTASPTCYCKTSSQGSLITFKGAGFFTPTPTNTPTPTFTPTPTRTPTPIPYSSPYSTPYDTPYTPPVCTGTISVWVCGWHYEINNFDCWWSDRWPMGCTPP